MARAMPSITGISSMATKAVLAELASVYEVLSGATVLIESIGGVDAVKRVTAGEDFDVVVLARDAIDKLVAGGHLIAGSEADIAQSAVAVAVRAGAPRPDIGSEAALRRAVLAARTIGYSTGPSGIALAKLFGCWGVAETLRERIVTPPPGVPVGALLLRGEVELGFQQLSELIHLEGIDVLGLLPPTIAIVTTFAAAVAVRASHPGAARALLEFMASPAAAEVKRRHGMDPPDAKPPRRGAAR
jgi:molybdate transport system substrate-binding protein